MIVMLVPKLSGLSWKCKETQKSFGLQHTLSKLRKLVYIYKPVLVFNLRIQHILNLIEYFYPKHKHKHIRMNDNK